MEAHETTAQRSPSTHNMAAPQTANLSATPTTSGHQSSNDESKVWQCIEQLSFIVNEMTKKEDKTTTWKPSSNMAPEPAKASMGLTEFRVWARSVMDYGRACKWPREQEAMSVRLLCDESIKKAIDARVKQCDWEKLSTRDAISVVQSVITGPKCKVGAWNEFFRYAQENQDTISEYIVKARPRAIECEFACPQCNSNLDEYMLARAIVIGLKDQGMKSEVLRNFSRLRSVSEVIETCEIYEAAEKMITPSSDNSVYACSARKDFGARRRPAPPGPASRVKENGNPLATARHQATAPQACSTCGLEGCPGQHQCPAARRQCFSCLERGHFKSKCPNKQTRVAGNDVTVSGTHTGDGEEDSAEAEVRV